MASTSKKSLDMAAMTEDSVQSTLTEPQWARHSSTVSEEQQQQQRPEKEDKLTKSKWIQIMDALLVGFDPIYFVITMGTGISSAVLYNFPIHSIQVGSKYVGIVYFFINLIAFFIIHVLFILRYFIHHKRYDNVSFIRLLKDQNQNVFLGAEVMGMATLINMIHFMKPEWRIFTYVLWWINVIMTLLSAWGISFIMFGINNFTNEQLNATILLPVVTLTVAASTGSIVGVEFMDYPMWQLSSDIITYMLLGNALMMGLPLIAVYFYKLLVFGLPPKQGVFSCFIPIGILGQGSYAILLNFDCLGKLIVDHNGLDLLGLNNDFSRETLLLIQSLLHLVSIYFSMFLLALGIGLTVISILSVLKYGIHYTWMKTMWAATFPLGTMAVAQTQIYKLTGLLGFKIMGTIYSVALIAITTFCLVNTALFEFPHKQILGILRGNDVVGKQSA